VIELLFLAGICQYILTKVATDTTYWLAIVAKWTCFLYAINSPSRFLWRSFQPLLQENTEAPKKWAAVMWLLSMLQFTVLFLVAKTLYELPEIIAKFQQ